MCFRALTVTNRSTLFPGPSRAVLSTASIFLIVAALFACQRIALAVEQGTPVAAVGETTYDFGEVYEGEHLAHTFRVRNTGSAPLELRDPAAKAENPTGGGGVVAASLRADPVARSDSFAQGAIVSRVMTGASYNGSGLGAGSFLGLGRPAAPS